MIIERLKLKNKFNITMIFDKNEWFILSENHKQFIKGGYGYGYERRHHSFCIRNNPYELVIDPNDELNQWDNWNIFDVKKQEYLQSGKLL